MFEKSASLLRRGASKVPPGGPADAGRTLRDGLDGCGVGTDQTAPTGSSLWWTAAHDRRARCRERDLLFVANGLPVAHASTPVSTMGHGLLLLSILGERWNLGAIAPAVYEQARVAAGRAPCPSWSSWTVNP
jgi:hypothetical protein